MPAIAQLRRFAARVLGTLRRSAADRGLEEEIRVHLDLLAADYAARGMSADEARAAALRDFGGVLRTTEAHRALRIFGAIETVAQDFRFAVRSYRRTPVFTLAAIVTLALTIGASTAIFALVNALDLRDLPVRDPASLVQVSTLAPPSFDPHLESGLSYSAVMALARQQTVFSSVISWRENGVDNVSIGGETVREMVAAVGGAFYSELGVKPVAGRFIGEQDVRLAELEPNMVAVLGYGFWQRQFGGDPNVVGRVIRIENVPFTVIGVAPRGFTGLWVSVEPAVTVPLTADPLLNGRTIASLRTSSAPSIHVTGRLKSGVSLAVARAELLSLWPRIRERGIPGSYSGPQRDTALATRLFVHSAATGFEPHLRQQFGEPLLLLLGVALLVLLIACVNLASLLVARTAARSQELGVRAAIGAEGWRLGRQLMTEGLLLSSTGAFVGVAVSWWGSDAIVHAMLADYIVPASLDVAPDWRVLGFSCVLAIAAGVLCTILPALRVMRGTGPDHLSVGARSAAPAGHAGRALIATQIALSLALLAPAGLLVRTLGALRDVHRGMDTRDVLLALPAATSGGYAGVNNDMYYPEVLQRLSAVPGVDRASISLMLPGRGSGVIELASARDVPAGFSHDLASVLTPVSPGFFRTLGIGLREGRDFDWRDNSRGRRVAIISHALARTLFGAAEAIGRHIRIGTAPGHQDLDVVGVVADARLYDVKSANPFAVYVPALQDPDANYKCFVLKGRAVPGSAVRRAIDSFGYEDVFDIESLGAAIDQDLLQDRIAAGFAGFFGGLALLLAAIGIYGLMSYSVGRRRREIGIRVALGAAPRCVTAEVVLDGLRVALAGMVVGLAAAFATTTLVRSLLFGVTPHDPITLAAASLALLGVALLAALLPAFRAARVDPMTALRAE